MEACAMKSTVGSPRVLPEMWFPGALGIYRRATGGLIDPPSEMYSGTAYFQCRVGRQPLYVCVTVIELLDPITEY